MFHHTPAHTHKQQTILCCNCCIPKCRCFCPLLKVTYNNNRVYLLYYGLDFTSCSIYLRLYLCIQIRVTNEEIGIVPTIVLLVHKNLFNCCFQKDNIFFNFGFPFPLLFTCQQKVLFVIKNIKIQLMLNCSSTATSSPMFFFILVAYGTTFICCIMILKGNSKR